MRITLSVFFNILILSSAVLAQNGPYAPAAGHEGSTAIHKDSSIIISWATEGFTTIGYMDINQPDSGLASHGSLVDIFGYSDNVVQSLGDGGTATYLLNPAVNNGPGPDFAIFENSFSDDFLEFAHVEVSSDGINFYRFPSSCLIQNDFQVDGFGSSDPTEVYNLAGKYRMEYGTPFDLSDLQSIETLNTNNVVAIRIIDVIGNINAPNVSFDGDGHIINDPYPTLFASSGFDLDALGIINVVTAIENEDVIISSVYPNPTENLIHIFLNNPSSYDLEIFNCTGDKVMFFKDLRNPTSIRLSSLNPGLYICKLILENDVSWVKIVKK